MNTTLQSEGIKVRIALRNTKGGNIGYLENIRQVHDLLPEREPGQYEDNFLNPISNDAGEEESPASIITYNGIRYDIKAVQTKFAEKSIPDGFNGNPYGFNFQIFYIVEPVD